MLQNRLGKIVRVVVPAAVLLFVGAAGANAAALSPAIALGKPAAALAPQVIVPVDMGNLELGTPGGTQRYTTRGKAYEPQYYDGRQYRKRRYYRHNRNWRRHRSSGVGIFLNVAPSYYGGDRCSYWARRCGANWGWYNNNYYGCLKYYGC